MEDLAKYSDAELMRKIREDNMFAFDELYVRYSKRVFSFAFSIIKSVEESENILQDVFLNLWEKRHNVEKDSSVKYYIFTIAYNSAISIIRKKARDAQFFDYLNSLQELYQDPPSLELEYSELTKTLNNIIDHLPQRQKDIYNLHKVEGLKYHEIAQRLSISVNTIETHMSRALKTIKENLGKSSLLAMLFYFLYV